jgi:hypothetical protein
MKVVERGHIYELESFEGMEIQKLKFISKNDGVIVHDGTTNEEVLKVLIDRIKILQESVPCRENEIVLQKLEESLMWLDRRTRERKSQGVEGKALPHKS